jgi:hypothetical protein
MLTERDYAQFRGYRLIGLLFSVTANRRRHQKKVRYARPISCTRLFSESQKLTRKLVEFLFELAAQVYPVYLMKLFGWKTH